MSVEYWQPWTPQVGDRVHVRLSGECTRKMRADSLAQNLPGVPPHHPACDGVAGTVISPEVFGLMCIDPLVVGPGHSIVVEFDDSFWADDSLCGFDTFAPIELEPLEGSAT